MFNVLITFDSIFQEKKLRRGSQGESQLSERVPGSESKDECHPPFLLEEAQPESQPQMSHINQPASPPPLLQDAQSESQPHTSQVDQPASPAPSQQNAQPESQPHLPYVDQPPSSPTDPPRRQINRAAYKLMLSIREEEYARKRKPTSRKPPAIDADSRDNNDAPPLQPWVQSELFTLYDTDKAIIESGKWLTDDIIDAGQKILAAQFKEKYGNAGFQSVVLGHTFSFKVESEDFVQILHDGHNHWLTISTVGAPPSSVLLYDSMYATAGRATQSQAASMMMVADQTLTLTFADVQMQAGGTECGVFALAFATAICFGYSPGKFQFNQPSMRSHLIECLEKQQFTMFPVKKERRQARKVKGKETIPLHCVCRMPMIKEAPMIQCSHCKKWYHGKHCTKTTKDAWLPGAKWFCSVCSCFSTQ